MKWKTVKFGDERIIKKFLAFPRNINGETRWLEMAYIRQKRMSGCWIDKEWVEGKI